MEAFDQPVCAVVPRAGGGLALALGDGFWLQAADGSMRRVYGIAQPEPPLGPVRMNDGKCDPAGRFWAGSMAYDGRPGAGCLYCLDIDGQVTEILRDVSVSNGLAWTQDGRTMYYIDSALQRVDAFDADPASGAIGNRRPAVPVPTASGIPDGMTLDDDGALWVAMWGGGGVHRYTPDGRLDTIVGVPCANATSCAFGGSDLGDLYITTSPHGLSDADRASQPLAGRLFRFRPGVTGPAAVAFGG
ncbi:MAG: SMP-30/gluconolactonase/LRE family protein [Deltaproteobacteria bacterium]|nr:SMP-30/gluconolactonase/LRE family protein [Deltaproteobacteria bacterium]